MLEIRFIVELISEKQKWKGFSQSHEKKLENLYKIA